MNERILDLAEQAGAIGYDDDGNELTPALVGKDLEKFAELIVRECAESASYYGNRVRQHVLKHFGVEE